MDRKQFKQTCVSKIVTTESTGEMLRLSVTGVVLFIAAF
jgi:hypothetical protein